MTADQTSNRDQRFDALNAKLSAPSKPEANIQSGIRAGKLLFLSGQVAFEGSDLMATGLLGDGIDIETGQACARQCAINLLGRIKEHLGSLEEVESIVKLTVFVASAPGFTDQSQVANGASDVFVEILGESGRHARSAVGMAGLPLGTPVEVEAVVLAR